MKPSYLVIGALGLVSLGLLDGCSSHEITAVRVAAPQSRFPISMSEYIVVDEAIASRDALDVVGQLAYAVPCAKPNSTADISDAINKQVTAAGGQGVIGFTASVSATEKCQAISLHGEIIKSRGAR
jgi:hypothetical protein